jgi:hypothetical protein
MLIVPERNTILGNKFKEFLGSVSILAGRIDVLEGCPIGFFSQ